MTKKKKKLDTVISVITIIDLRDLEAATDAAFELTKMLYTENIHLRKIRYWYCSKKVYRYLRSVIEYFIVATSVQVSSTSFNLICSGNLRTKKLEKPLIFPFSIYIYQNRFCFHHFQDFAFLFSTVFWLFSYKITFQSIYSIFHIFLCEWNFKSL